MARDALVCMKDRNVYRQYQVLGKKWSESFTWKEATQASLSLLQLSVDSGKGTHEA